jgi:NADH-quinone oxidoreductase subunit C
MGRTAEELLERAQQRFPDKQIAVDALHRNALDVAVECVLEFFEWLKTDPELDFDYLDFSTITDRPPDHMDAIYSVYSFKHKHRLGVKVKLSRQNPTLPTLTKLWRNAEWNERETIDLFGVHFSDHPDPRRLMMPDDWEGHPLRKDYMHPNLVQRPD